MGAVRRLLTGTLIVSLSVVGLPMAVTASDDRPRSAGRALTIGGRSLSEVVGAPAAVVYRFALASLLDQADGQIGGVAVDAGGQPVAGRRVELARPRSEGEGRLVATTDVNGTFSFSGLGSGRYQAQLLIDDRVVATSEAIDLVEGAMQVSGVTLALAAEKREGLGLGAAMAIGAGVGLGVILLFAAATAGVPP